MDLTTVDYLERIESCQIQKCQKHALVGLKTRGS